jgi:hypothetical protein
LDFAQRKAWHGAIATTAMTHIAIQEQLDGKITAKQANYVK